MASSRNVSKHIFQKEVYFQVWYFTVVVTSSVCDGVGDVWSADIQTMTTTLKQALKTHFGFENFRSKVQEDVVKSVIRGKSVNTLYLLCLFISMLTSRREVARSKRQT